jgi:hypothetical protein
MSKVSVCFLCGVQLVSTMPCVRQSKRATCNPQLDGAIQQIVLMGLSESDVVVGQACRLIGAR